MHLIVQLRTTGVANRTIREGIVISGRRVWARCMRRELRRCLKCQSLTASHLVANCEAPNTCGTCAKEHKTAECTKSDNNKFWCINCKESGHASWDCLFPCFLEASRWLETTDPEHTYRFSPSQEPCTWDQAPPKSGPYPERWQNPGGTPTQEVGAVCDQGPNYTRGPTDHPSMYTIEHNDRSQPWGATIPKHCPSYGGPSEAPEPHAGH